MEGHDCGKGSWIHGALAASVGLAAVVLILAAAPGASAAVARAGREAQRPASSLASAQIAALTRRGLSTARAREAIETQSAIAETEIVAKLEVALGAGFGGAWFDPAAAQLHIGVTSKAGHGNAEAIAASVDLAAHVTETPVRSNWVELRDAQRQWDRRLADLFAHGQVATWPEPQKNSVGVRLGSSVPAARRAAIERMAAASDVDVSLFVASQPQLGMKPLAKRCVTFKAAEAYCDAPIVSGTSLTGPEVEVEGKKGKARCTTGPAVIRTDISRNTTETFVLTAGHCMDKEGRGKIWSAFDGFGNEKAVGQAVDFLNGPEGNKADVGVIRIENEEWIDNTLTPVPPTVAPWSEAEAVEPIPIVDQATAKPGDVTCMSGQTTGKKCGTVKATGVTLETKNNGKVEELVEVTGFKAEEGDSGGPMFFEKEQGELEKVALIQGTLVGKEKTTGNPVYEPLSYSFEQLKQGPRKLDLELLTTANQKRPPCPMPSMEACFDSEAETTTLEGTGVTTSVFTTNFGTLDCSVTELSGTQTGTPVSGGFSAGELTVHPEYAGCQAFGFSATVNTTGCNYVLHAGVNTEAAVDLACEAGKSLTVVVGGGVCSLTVPGQANVGKASFTDEGTGTGRTVRASVEAEGLAYSGSGFLCSGSATNGTYTGSVSTKGFSEGEQVGIWVTG